MQRSVAEQANAADAKVEEDLAAEAYGAQGAAVVVFMRLGVGAGALVGVGDETSCGSGVLLVGQEFEAAAGVVQVEQGSATGFGNHAQGFVEDFAALATGGEEISGGALGVHADEYRFSSVVLGSWSAEVAFDQGDVAFAAVDFALVGDHAEVAVSGGDGGFGGAGDVALVLQAVADELGDGEHLHVVLGAELDEVGNARHGAVVVHNFADHSRRIEACKAGEIY